MSIICPNFNNKEVKQQFDEIAAATSEQAAYHIWSQNNGNAIDRAPNGAPSKLFSDLLEHFNGDRKATIQAKAKVFSESFKTWFGDWNTKSKTVSTDAAKRLVAYLEEIPKESRYKTLAQLLIDSESLPFSLRYFDINNNRDDIVGTSGQWNSFANLIEVLGSNVNDDSITKTLLHELIHYNTEYLLETYRKNPDNLTETQRKNIESIHKAINYAKKYILDNYDESKFRSIKEKQGVTSRIFYAFDNHQEIEIDEVISEAFTNPAFQEVLNEIPYEGTKQSIFDRIIEAIVNIFGLKVKDNSVLKEIITHSSELTEIESRIKSTNVSKVVDENGEPIILYHTVLPSYNASFGVFNTINEEGNQTMIYFTDNLDMSKSYARNHRLFKTLDNVKKRLSEIPAEIIKRNEYVTSNLNKLTSDETYIKELGYTGFEDQSLLDLIDYYKKSQVDYTESRAKEKAELEAIIENPKSIEYTKLGFLNLKNPLVINGRGNWWNELSLNPDDDIVKMAKHNDLVNKTIEDRTRGEAERKLKDNPALEVLPYDELLGDDEIEKIRNEVTEEVLKELGDLYKFESTRTIEEYARNIEQYDGVIFENIRDYGAGGIKFGNDFMANTVYAAKNPNQIKSAVGNTGEFSKETPNIYAAQSSSTAIPLTDSSKWLYRKYNLLNSKGEIKTIPYTSKKQIATADKWVATLNKNKLNYKFAIKLTPVGHKILIYDTTPNLFGSNSTESEILNKINALSPEELRGQAVESPKVNTNIVNSNDVFAELTNSEDTTLATLATAVKSMVDSLSDEGIEIVYTSETLDTLFPGTLIHSKTPAVYDPVSNKIYVSTSVSLQGHAYSGNPKHAMQRILLHEIVHAYTVKALHGDSASAKKLNELFEAYKAKHTDYAATNIAEFVAELFSNPSVMTNMMDIESGNMSLLQRLYEWFKSLFTSKSELSSEAVQAVLDLITEHNADMTLTLDDEQAPIPFAANSVREELAIERLNSTFNDVKESILSKLATLRYNKFNKQAAAKSEKEQSSLLYRLKTISENLTGEAMMDMADQLDGIVEYIDNVASSMTDMRTLLVGDGTTKGIEQRMQEAISSNDAATLQEIEAILDDFYRNSLKPIKDNLDKIYDTLTEPNNRNVYMPVVGIDQYQIILDMTHGLIEQLSPERMANQDNIGYTYKNIAIQKTQNYLLNRGIEAKDPGIMNALKNWLKIDRDINFFERWAGSSTSSRNFILRLVAKQINDIDNYVVRTHHNAFAKLRKVAVGTNKRMHLFELDENGKKTGFLIRDRKYGVYNTDRSAFRDSWLMSHDILSFNDLKLNKQLYKQYLKDMNVWIDERANRRYTKEYYDIFADLSVEATEALDEANDMIENIVYQYRGKTTRKIRFEDMPEDVYEEYKYAIQRKRNLANPYNYDTGEAKTGLEKDIADEIRAMNEKLSKGLKSKANMDAFYAEMQAVKDSSEPIPFGKSKYDLWLERNTRFDYTEDFKKFLEMRAKKEYGDAYNNLRESLNNILNLYRNHNNEIDYTIMPESAKEMVRRLDIAMAKIAATKRGGVRSQKAFNVRLSEVVNENGGKDALVSGVDTYVDGTKVRYHSYLTKLEPIDSANNVVRVPNNNWNETTEESSYWNPDYDSAVKDKEQPKKSIARYNNDKGFELLNPNSPRFDKNLRDLYDAIIDMIHEANDKLHFQENANDYKLPQKTGGFQNYIAGAGLIHGFGKYIKDHTRILSQDEGFGGDHMTTADGRRILLPPTHYMAMLDDTTIGTNDLVGVVGAYYKMALNYEAKEKISHQLNLINDIVKDYAEYNSEGTRRRSPDANLSKKIDQLIKMFVYGEKNAKYELNLLGTKIAIGKLLNSFTSWGRNSGLAHNPRSAMTGGISAATFYYNESKVGNIYNGSNLTNGTAVALKEYLTLKMLMDTGKNVSTNSLIFGMMEYNGISFDQDEETKHVGRMRIGRIAGNIGAKYNFFKLASILPNSFILPAIYDNYRLVTKQDGTKEFMSENHFVKFEEIPGISNDNPASIKQKQAIFRTFKENLWSAYSQDKDGTIRVKDEYKQYVTAELENEVTSKAKWVASHAEGMATGVDKTGLFYHPAAAVMFLFRYFIMKNIENAFAKMHWNYEIKTVMMGTLTALFQGYMYGTNHKWYTKLYNRIDAIRDSSGFVSFIKAIAIGKSSPEMNAKRLAALEELKKEFGDIDIKTEIARYQTRFNSQISGFFFWSIVVSNLISIIFGGDTDDDDDYFVNMGLYMLRRVELETGSRYNPSDIASIVNSISPLTKHFSNVIHAINMFEESDDKKIKKGAYKGLYGWQRDVIRVVPILNAYYNMKNPKEKLNNLKNTLNR